MQTAALRGFYAILDVRGERTPDVSVEVSRAEQLLAAGPCCLQLRAKKLGAGAIVALGRILRPLAHAAGVPFCMNDRLDLALAVGADVLHVGQDDLPLLEVRGLLARLGRQMMVGVSTHSLAQARAAHDEGADYIGLGPIFRTNTKERPDPVVGLGGLRQVVAAVPLPVVAIGGITRESVAAVAKTGAAAAAVIGDIDLSIDRIAAGRAVGAVFLRRGDYPAAPSGRAKNR